MSCMSEKSCHGYFVHANTPEEVLCRNTACMRHDFRAASNSAHITNRAPLTTHDRTGVQKFQDMAAEDKTRYKEEMKSYVPPTEEMAEKVKKSVKTVKKRVKEAQETIEEPKRKLTKGEMKM